MSRTVHYDTNGIALMKDGKLVKLRGKVEGFQDDDVLGYLTEDDVRQYIEEMVDTAICALTLLVNATTPEQFRLAAEMVNCKNQLRQYGEAEEGGSLA